jgi:hypothetical protein
MANSNKKFNPGQGKTPQQYEDSAKFAWYGVVGMVILLILFSLLNSCTTTKKVDECCKTEKTSAK